MRIAICTPTYGDVTAEYAKCLAGLVVKTVQASILFNGVATVPEVEVFMSSSSVLPQLRNVLVKRALEWDANYLLWVDADQSFPDDGLLQLLSHNLPVVGANYPRRGAPFLPTAVGMDGKLTQTTAELARSRAVVPIRRLGLGFCLMDMHVVASLRQLSPDEAAQPLFVLTMVGDGTQIVGEDDYLFDMLIEAGVQPYLDHALSWQIGHVSKRILTNADAGAPT